MKKKNIKHIISWIMYFVGFVTYIVCLTQSNNISTEAWLYAIGASLGVLLFTLSGYLRH